MKVIAIAADVETTGFDVLGSDLIVCAMVEILEGYTIGRGAVWYHRPQSTKYFTRESQAIHGISYWKAQEFPYPAVSCRETLDWIGDLSDLPLVSHSLGGFDHRWIDGHFSKHEMGIKLRRIFPKDKVISTVKLSRDNLAHIPNHKLDTVAKYYDIPLNHHEALSDAMACAQIYCNIKLNINTWTGALL